MACVIFCLAISQPELLKSFMESEKVDIPPSCHFQIMLVKSCLHPLERAVNSINVVGSLVVVTEK